MLYYIFDYLDKNYDFPGVGLFQFLSFRAALAVITSFFISLFIGRIIIKALRNLQIGESIRDLGLQGQIEKKGTPTMGGLIIILATIVPVILFTKLHNIYIILLIVTTLWMGLIGFLDDYIKVFKKNKAGLKGKFKVIGQLCLGIIVAVSLYTHPEVTIKQKLNDVKLMQVQDNKVDNKFTDEEKSLKTTIPFLKDNELNYSNVLSFIFGDYSKYAWLLFIPVVIFIITAVSNGANLTDGLDGLAAGSSIIIVLILGVFAWISGNIIFSDYLNIMYIPRVGEVSVFIAAFAGALIGFLWYNAYPAQVFMGDTGSLTIGGVIAVIAIIVRKELLLPIICGVFMIETLSVIFQVTYFKYTKKKFGQGRRILLMSPLHHHYQKKGIHESKIVSRFWIVCVVLAVVAIVTLKIR